jgi:hypothetical protein
MREVGTVVSFGLATVRVLFEPDEGHPDGIFFVHASNLEVVK